MNTCLRNCGIAAAGVVVACMAPVGVAAQRSSNARGPTSGGRSQFCRTV